MDDAYTRMIRVSLGVYRRGDKDIVRLRDANGRQRQITTNSRLEAEHVNVFVHVSGWGSAPDALCDTWLRLQSLGVGGSAGLLETSSLAGLR